ncbi:MAG: citrate synthase [Glaciecola sp.]|jgi:citrate synthase
MSDVAKIQLGDEHYELPIITGSEEERAIDISKLRGMTNHITLDVGFKNTGSTKSAITYLDGEKGILSYRGYPIEQLAEKSSFLEVSYLLINGELPNKKELEYYTTQITSHTLVHEDLRRFFEAFPTNAHPMGILSTMVASLSTFYPESQNPNRAMADVELTITRLLAKLPTLAAMAHKYSKGQPLLYPDNNLGYIDNFLRMMFGLPVEEYKVNPVISDAMNKLLILHADHEQNCSASTVRIVGSSQANLYSSISAGVAALWGPLHGGANQAVIEMLENIQKDGGGMQKWIDKAKDKNDSFRLMGFGHRVYKNFDPRATIIKQACDSVLETLGVDDPILDLAKELEAVALKDEYFINRKLFPNVDFYSGIIYKALGIPSEMFTVMFALGRLPGWIAQWKEMIENGDPIGRPRQVYVGATPRDYVPMDKR